MIRWNYERHKYVPYEGPDGAMLYSDDMDAECVCANCGKRMKFGDGYTSLEIHNKTGFGYTVCAACHNEERIRRVSEYKKTLDIHGIKSGEGAAIQSPHDWKATALTPFDPIPEECDEDEEEEVQDNG